MNFPWFRRSPLSPLAQSYREQTEPHVSRRTPLDQLKFVVLDAETTGFEPRHDRILSLAAVPVTRGVLRLAELRSWIVYQSVAPMTAAVSVHGILPAETAGGETEPAVLAEFLPMIAGAVLVGHHLAFDIAMLNETLHRHHRIRLRNPTLDTAELAMHALEAFRKTGYPGQRAPSLEEVCTHCEIAPLERHTAPGDTFTTAELLLVLCAKLSRHLGRTLTAADLPLGPK